MKPGIGRIVHYKLCDVDVSNIVTRRGSARLGNRVESGQVYPAMIVRVWDDGPAGAVNLQVFLDGYDVEWVTSRQVGLLPGTFAWPGAVAPPSQPVGVAYGDRI